MQKIFLLICQTIIPNLAENIKNIFAIFCKMQQKSPQLSQKIKKWKKIEIFPEYGGDTNAEQMLTLTLTAKVMTEGLS